jgi:hypothetical protein
MLGTCVTDREKIGKKLGKNWEKIGKKFTVQVGLHLPTSTRTRTYEERAGGREGIEAGRRVE